MSDDTGPKASPTVENVMLPEGLLHRKRADHREEKGGYPVLTRAHKQAARSYREEEALRLKRVAALTAEAKANSDAIVKEDAGRARAKPAQVDRSLPPLPEAQPVKTQGVTGPSPGGTVFSQGSQHHVKARASGAATEMTEKKVAEANKASARETTDAVVRKIEGVAVRVAPGLGQGSARSTDSGRGGRE